MIFSAQVRTSQASKIDTEDTQSLHYYNFQRADCSQPWLGWSVLKVSTLHTWFPLGIFGLKCLVSCLQPDKSALLVGQVAFDFQTRMYVRNV